MPKVSGGIKATTHTTHHITTLQLNTYTYEMIHMREGQTGENVKPKHSHHYALHTAVCIIVFNMVTCALTHVLKMP